MARKKKLINNTSIPQREIEIIARCIFPDILAFYESEEGQREFAEWKAQQAEKPDKEIAAQLLGEDYQKFEVVAKDLMKFEDSPIKEVEGIYAIANYEVVLENHQSPVIFYNLGCAYEANNEPDKAISAHLKAVTLNEKFPYSYKKLGLLFLSRGDTDSAREYFEDYIKLDIAQDEKNSVKDILDRI